MFQWFKTNSLILVNAASLTGTTAVTSIIGLFAVGDGLTAMSSVLDQAMIGLLRGGLQLWRNTLFTVTKLAALLVVSLWLSYTTGLTIYATWLIGNAVSLLALAGFAFVK